MKTRSLGYNKKFESNNVIPRRRGIWPWEVSLSSIDIPYCIIGSADWAADDCTNIQLKIGLSSTILENISVRQKNGIHIWNLETL